MLKRGIDTAPQVLMIQEAARAQAGQRGYLARKGTHWNDNYVMICDCVIETMREILVDKLRYMDDEQFIAAVALTETDILPAIEQAEEDQREYEYQQAHNI